MLKNTSLTCLLISLCSLLFLNSCEEIIQNLEPCDFNYGALAFTKGPANQVQEITPSFSQRSATGTFSSSPAGLVIDAETGVIDVNASDPGEYTITHEDETTCKTSILIQEGEKECSLVYQQQIVAPGQVDFLLARVNGERVNSGKFYATPAGLAISDTNGSIDVRASESGIEYMVFYESEDKNTTCQTTLTISGINYEDTRIDFTNEVAIVAPFFVKEEQQQAPVGIYDIDGAATELNLSINRETGEINLKETLQTISGQEFDGDLPSGFTRKFTISYRLPAQELESNIEVQLFWYANEDDIPDDLLELLVGKGVPTNGKIEKRPPYILTVGEYGQ